MYHHIAVAFVPEVVVMIGHFRITSTNNNSQEARIYFHF
jgi:hypothetical protein